MWYGSVAKVMTWNMSNAGASSLPPGYSLRYHSLYSLTPMEKLDVFIIYNAHTEISSYNGNQNYDNVSKIIESLQKEE